MITFMARLKMKAGKESEALERLKKMVAAVQEKEPGALAYCCHQNDRDPAEIVFYEIYADEDAKDAHMETPHFEELMELIGDVLDADFGVQVEDLRPVAGFCREVPG